MKNTKRLLTLTVALIMLFALAACDGDTAPTNPPTPSNGDTAPTNTPATNNTPTPTPQSDNDPAQTQEAESQINDSPLTLQIIDSRTGIFRLRDPDIQESYPIPNSAFDDFAELYTWDISFNHGTDQYGITLSMNNMNKSQNPTENRAPSNLNLYSRIVIDGVYMGESGSPDSQNLFPVQFQIVGDSLYFRFTIPDTYDFDLYSVGYANYLIINNPNNVNIFGHASVPLNDILVSDIETGAVKGG